MSYLTQSKLAAPSTPASGKGTWYIDVNGEPRFKDDNGVDIALSPKWKYNWMRNGGFWFAQRQAPGTLTTYSNLTGRAIAADGWGITNENASVQYLRVDTMTSPETNLYARYYGQFTKITSTGKLVISQVVEGFDTANLRGSTFRIQAKIKAVTSNITVRLAVAFLTTGSPDTGMPATFVTAFGANATDPTLGTNLAYITPKAGVNADGGTVRGNAIDCTVTSAVWGRFGGVFDIPTSARNIVILVFSDSQLIPNNGISISEVSLTDGQATQDWAPNSISQELVKVQRFYCKSFNIDVLPAQNVGLVGAVRGYVSVAGATANQPVGVRFPVPMRAAPTTFVFYNPSAANAFARNTTAATNATALALGGTSGDQGFDAFFTGIAAWTIAQSVAFHFTADAEI